MAKNGINNKRENMIRQIYLWLLLGWFSIPLAGQTILYPGDIAIVGIQTDNPDNFTFVFLTSIQRHTVVYFTDCGVKMDGSFRNGEGGLRYTAPDDLAAGTLVNYIRDSSDFSKANDPILGSRGFNLSSSGDQIIAFQDSSIHPRYLFAIQTNSSKWQHECTNTNVSCLPPGLTEGYTAICAGKDTGSNNYWHNAVLKRVPSGKTKDKSLTEICLRNNWTFSNSIIPQPTDKICLVPDSNRYIKLAQDSSTSFYFHDSLHFDIVESNIYRLSIWIKDINSQDSFLLQNHWPSALKSFAVKFPYNIVQDSFQLIINDADFPGFLYRSRTMAKKDTIPLLFLELKPKVIMQGDSIRLVFNKALRAIQDSLILRNYANHSDSMILCYSSGAISLQNNEVVLKLNNVQPGTSYVIEIRQGWVCDLSGNPFPGISKENYPMFKVAPKPLQDTIGPNIISIEPSLDLPFKIDQYIRFIFNEPLYSWKGELTNPDIIGDIISIRDSSANYYNFKIEFDSLFTSFELLPLGLEPGKSYCISFYGFSDSSGNKATDFIFNFETEKIISSERKNFTKESLQAYPNPANDVIQVMGNNLIQALITITDISGRPEIVKVMKCLNDKIVLNISFYAAGVYIINLDNKKEKKQVRFLKN